MAEYRQFSESPNEPTVFVSAPEPYSAPGKLKPAHWIAVGVVGAAGLIAIVLSVVFLFVEEQLHLPIIMFPFAFGLLVLAMILYGGFSNPYKWKQFYQWK